ncbi:MAG: NACHT domain-containing protein [Brasilonema octagenarum HA4186-MV1]|jgi:predicted NACHT family NTPase|nr:NACHT domain-containing protein [Brasilonema octagenarum HA4186-MV1]
MSMHLVIDILHPPTLYFTQARTAIDHCVPLGELFVNVNILESLSSSRRSELDDLWQDFTRGNSDYRSLDRIGLGKKQQRMSGFAVLERNTNLMVLGKPGSGKTTYLQRIVTECNAGKLQAQRIPVLIKLRYFVDEGREYAYNLEQFLGQQWGLRNTDIKLVLSQGRALVLLDGLDEVTGEAGKQIAKEIKRFTRIYPQVQVVVTCRTQSQESRFERFDYVEVADFNEEQVRAFAQHWFETVCADGKGETQAPDFLSQLFRQQNKPIRELAITPILLSLTCAVFQQTGKFYSKRSKLYEEGLDLLLEQWDKSREVERDEIYRDLSVDRKLELLSFLAVKKFEQEKYVLFDQEELERYIAEFLGIERRDSRGVLRAIASQHGLLIERAQKVWSFSHLTFQEYLVAREIVETRLIASLQNLVEHIITEKHYWQVLLLTAEMMQNADFLFLLMKDRIDRLLSLDENLQDFLEWVNHKSLLVQASYKPAAVRAFYFALEQRLILDWDKQNKKRYGESILIESNSLDRKFQLACSIDEAIDYSLTLELDIDYAQELYIDIEHIKEWYSQQEYEYQVYEFDEKFKMEDNSILEKMQFELSEVTNRVNDPFRKLYQEMQYDLKIVDFITFSFNFQDVHINDFIETVITEKLSTKLKDELKILVHKISNKKLNLDNGFQRWWDINYKVWFKELKNIMLIQHRNIGHDWEFNDAQKELLQKYYDANQLLADCLNSDDCYINREVRQEIEDNLLLPIAEIEKRKREKQIE